MRCRPAEGVREEAVPPGGVDAAGGAGHVGAGRRGRTVPRRLPGAAAAKPSFIRYLTIPELSVFDIRYSILALQDSLHLEKNIKVAV